jgi:hypothetical protein
MNIIVIVVWTVLMMAWAGVGVYGYDRAKPYGLGNWLVPWACVLILGLVVFGAFRSFS